MDNIFDILKIDKEVVINFPLQANLVINHEVEKAVNRNVNRLAKIEQGLLTEGGLNVSPKSIKDVIDRVIQSSKVKDLFGEEWTPSELRLISYNLSLLHNDEGAFSYALELLNSKWRNLFINGITFYLINSWNLIPQNFREKTSKLLKDKLMAYNEYNKRYLAIKDHADLFDESGPLRLSMLLIRKSEELFEAPKYFGYKQSMIALSYFSDVIIEYISKNNIEDISIIENILESHNIDRTKKLVYANLIEKADLKMNDAYKNRVSISANKVIGEITSPITWKPFLGASKDDKKRLSKAKEFVNKWVAKKFIEVFFDKCVQDPTRKEFWLKYAEFINDFKIAGSQATKIKLTNDEKIGEACNSYFCQTSSKVGKTSALILYIKDKVFIEFSDIGSVYVYDSNYQVLKILAKMSQYKIEDLKLTSLDPLIITNEGYFVSKKYTMNMVGRLSHTGYWQDRLANWFEEILKIDPELETIKSNRKNNQGNIELIVPKTVNFNDVKILTRSKLLFNGKIRIYADSNDFWLSSDTKKLYHICKSFYYINQYSSIWVKESKKHEGYLEIKISLNSIETIGYIKKMEKNIFKFIDNLTNKTSYIFLVDND